MRRLGAGLGSARPQDGSYRRSNGSPSPLLGLSRKTTKEGSRLAPAFLPFHGVAEKKKKKKKNFGALFVFDQILQIEQVKDGRPLAPFCGEASSWDSDPFSRFGNRRMPHNR